MKIISALKAIKHLDRKINTTTERLKKWCSFITDKAVDQAIAEADYKEEDIRRMQQQIWDWSREKVRLRKAIHKTNALTKLSFGGHDWTIDELLLHKTLTLPTQIATLRSMRRMEKGYGMGKEFSVVNQFDSKGRDREIERLNEQMEEADHILDEVTLAVDIIED